LFALESSKKIKLKMPPQSEIAGASGVEQAFMPSVVFLVEERPFMASKKF